MSGDARPTVSALAVALVLIALQALSGLAHGHQQHAALTSVTLNPRTDTIEVIHRLFAHDVERVVGAADGDALARIGAYVSAAFRLATSDDEPLALGLVGVELDGHLVWVYQEAAWPPRLQGLSIENRILMDLWPDQRNRVNVTADGRVQTRLFHRGRAVARVTLARDGAPDQ
mgnify:CR=1 FL=1